MSRTIIGDLALREELLSEAVQQSPNARRETLRRNLAISSDEVAFLASWMGEKNRAIAGGGKKDNGRKEVSFESQPHTLSTIYENEVFYSSNASDTVELVRSRESVNINTCRMVMIIVLNILVLSVVAATIFILNYGF